MNEDHAERQSARDREYARAWAEAPESFKIEAGKMGMHVQPESYDSPGVREYDDNFPSSIETPDMADSLDSHIDFIIEKHGIQHAGFIKTIAEELKRPMHEEITKNQAEVLGRIAGYLIYMESEKGNLLARLHALLHAIPRFAVRAGFPSMRASAKVCKVSPEWMRRKRDQWCILLGINPPSAGCKTPEAKAKYSENARNNHWRNQRYKKQ